MAGRTIEGYRRRMWHMARVRLRDIRAVPWGAGVADIPLPGGGTRPATVGDVYTSERTVASLLRWHVRYPGRLFVAGAPAPQLRNAFTLAGLAANIGDPTTWADADENRLMDGITAEVLAMNNAEFTSTMTSVRDWPTWTAAANPRGYALSQQIGRLALGRGSFRLDDTDLPPAP